MKLIVLHRSRRSHRRGSAYVLVLSITLLITVMGMGALTLSRTAAKTTAESNDWEAAGALAFSATEHALSYLNAASVANATTWRSSYTSGSNAFTQSMGRGSFSWTVKDEVDGNFSADYQRAFRVYGIGRVGEVTRVYSVVVLPGGGPLDVLRTPIHSSSTLTMSSSGSGNIQAIGGPFSSNSRIALSANTAGDVEAASTTGTQGNGNYDVPATAKRMPSVSIYNAILPNASVISYGNMNNVLISPSSNPSGSVNPAGLYRISVAANQTLKIKDSRIVGTLLVSLGSGASLQLQGAIEWEPANRAYPSLIVYATGTGADVSFAGSTNWLSETSTNFNPAGTPYNGVSNSTMTDDYPPYYQGVFQIICGSSGTVEVGSNAYIKGTLVTDSPVTLTAQSTLIQDAAIYAQPPYGYATGPLLIELPGSWRWDTLP